MYTDYLEIYLNYLHTIEIYQEYGEIYGDTLELIKMYEDKLSISDHKKLVLIKKQK